MNLLDFTNEQIILITILQYLCGLLGVGIGYFIFKPSKKCSFCETKRRETTRRRIIR